MHGRSKAFGKYCPVFAVFFRALDVCTVVFLPFGLGLTLSLYKLIYNDNSLLSKKMLVISRPITSRHKHTNVEMKREIRKSLRSALHAPGSEALTCL